MRWLALAWLGLAAFIGLVLGNLNLPRLLHLYRHAGMTTGTVEHTDCGDHNSVYFAFVVDARSFSGHGTAGGPCGALRDGQQITVYYAIGEPEISSLKEPGADLRNEVTTILLACVLFPTLAVGGWIARFRLKSA